jgi:hypothetical protein
MILFMGCFGISLPDCWVRKMENSMRTTIPPTYTIICTAAINSTWSQKYKAAIPMRENNNQIADRKIFLVVIASNPAPRMKAAIM